MGARELLDFLIRFFWKAQRQIGLHNVSSVAQQSPKQPAQTMAQHPNTF
jgi:hypothetical protein